MNIWLWWWFRAGLVQEWVQLNYDGLAQKAGCPQEALMEVMTMMQIKK